MLDKKSKCEGYSKRASFEFPSVFRKASAGTLDKKIGKILQKLIDHLWKTYQSSLGDAVILMNALKAKGLPSVTLDHFAIIDLPGKNSGIPVLSALFSELGYEFRGRGYLADKQNDFVWMAPVDAKNHQAKGSLPQVVIADFRLEELPLEVRMIIEKYAAQVSAPPFDAKHRLNDYFLGRDWSLPTVSEYRTVAEFNELLAWVLLFGRVPNHFGLSVHLMQNFNDMEQFIQFVQEDAGLSFNTSGGIIKGTPAGGIIQCSTMGRSMPVELADGEVEVPERFIEFVWRYPQKTVIILLYGMIILRGLSQAKQIT